MVLMQIMTTDKFPNRGTRLANAKLLVKKGLVSKVDFAVDENNKPVDDVYQVVSQSDKGQSYMVFEGQCDCDDKKFNGGQECKHELAVMISKGEKIDNEIVEVKVKINVSEE